MFLPKSFTAVTSFSRYLILSLFVILPIVAFFFGMIYQQRVDISTQIPDQQVVAVQNNKNVASQSCGDFTEFSDYVLKTIQQPDSKKSLKNNPYIIKDFRWKRDQAKPFETYPVIKISVSTYGRANFWPNEIIVSAIRNDSTLLEKTINEKAESIGFVVDSLNTLPFQTFSNRGVLQEFAFRNGNDIYSVVLYADWATQAAGQGYVAVTCGRALEKYSKIYDLLNLKADPKMEDPYDNDYVSIGDVSPDSTVYALYGSRNQINDFIEYYYFDGTSLKLVSKGSSPTQCKPLETLKIGKGMRCIDTSYERFVTY